MGGWGLVSWDLWFMVFGMRVYGFGDEGFGIQEFMGSIFCLKEPLIDLYLNPKTPSLGTLNPEP